MERMVADSSIDVVNNGTIEREIRETFEVWITGGLKNCGSQRLIGSLKLKTASAESLWDQVEVPANIPRSNNIVGIWSFSL